MDLGRTRVCCWRNYMYMHTSRGRDNAYVKRVTMSLLGSISAGVFVLLSSPLTHCPFGVTVPVLGTSFALGPPKRPFAPTHSAALSLSQLRHAESCPPDRTQAYLAAQSYHQPCRRAAQDLTRLSRQWRVPHCRGVSPATQSIKQTAHHERHPTASGGAGSATPQLLGE
jgi:hypothetical protein